MRPYLLLALIPFFSSCKISTIYPMTGAVVGGAGGAIAGPATAGAGAGLGYAVGERLKDADDEESDFNRNLKVIEALSEGDVKALVAEQLTNAETSWVDNVLEQVYGLLKLSAFGFALYLLIPIIYTKYLHKKNERIK